MTQKCVFFFFRIENDIDVHLVNDSSATQSRPVLMFPSEIFNHVLRHQSRCTCYLFCLLLTCAIGLLLKLQHCRGFNSKLGKSEFYFSCYSCKYFKNAGKCTELLNFFKLFVGIMHSDPLALMLFRRVWCKATRLAHSYFLATPLIFGFAYMVH